ncbi:hypothetical protein AYO22_11713 [Fonsecaea multimorphosa]|nr:hypothetical protein AYO22_11713 [Fonsecaea multimorphosa]
MSPAATSSASAGPNWGVLLPLEIHIPDDAIEELKTLIRCSKIAGPTYENSFQGGTFGVSRQWLLEAKRKWEDFDWFVKSGRSPVSGTVLGTNCGLHVKEAL